MVQKYRNYLKPYERKYLKILVKLYKSNITKMAKRASTSRTHIKRMLKRHKLYIPGKPGRRSK